MVTLPLCRITEGNTVLNGKCEIWKDIPGFEGRYQASDQGRIQSIQDNHGNYREQLRSTWVSTKGYEYVQLFIKDKRHNVSVHHAVATAFIPNPDQKATVNHVDGNKLNNCASNLEWATYSENLKHAHASGLKKGQSHWKGRKGGSTSGYHNVTYDPSRNRWIASIKHEGKMKAKRFSVKKYGDQAEILAAQAVNDLLDELGITDRAKNIIP